MYAERVMQNSISLFAPARCLCAPHQIENDVVINQISICILFVYDFEE